MSGNPALQALTAIHLLGGRPPAQRLFNGEELIKSLPSVESSPNPGLVPPVADDGVRGLQ